MSSTPRGQRRLRGALTAGVVAIAACAMFASPAMADDGSSASPSAPAGSAPTHGKTTFVIGLKQDIDSLNPYVGVLASAFDAYQMMYDYLTDAAPKDMSVVPSLASSWDTSADGKTWTFHLRQGVKWSDGQPLTSDDVVYSYERVLAPDSTENGQYGSSFPEGTKVTRSGRQHGRDHHADSRAPACWARLRPAVCRSSRSTSGRTSPRRTSAPSPNDGSAGPVVGSGPFTLKAAKKGQYYQFTANPNYWNGTPAHRRTRHGHLPERRDHGAGAAEGRHRLRPGPDREGVQRTQGQGRPEHHAEHRRQHLHLRGGLQQRCRHHRQQADRQRQRGPEERRRSVRPSTTPSTSRRSSTRCCSAPARSRTAK